MFKRHAGRYIVLVLLVIILLLTTICRFLLVDGLGFSEEQASTIVGIAEVVVAAVAAAMVVFQLEREGDAEERQSDIEEAKFILQYNQTFVQDENMTMVESLLEQQKDGKIEGPIITDENRQQFINYLVYLEGLAPLILRDVLHLDHIDDLMAYRFFLAMNNKEVQEDQLKPDAAYYKGCFKLYKKWKQYRKRRGYPILLEENSIDKWECFEEFSEESSICVRELLDDDKLEEVASLIYHTDPYIYPALFGKERNARKILPELISEKEGVFSKENIMVAAQGNKIVGVVVYFKETPKYLWDGAKIKEKWSFLPVSFMDACNGYVNTLPDYVAQEKKQAYIACVCVDKKQRGKGIGHMLLKKMVSICEGYQMRLHVLKDNETATKLYENYGFVSQKEEDGYAYGQKPPKSIEMIREV